MPNASATVRASRRKASEATFHTIAHQLQRLLDDMVAMRSRAQHRAHADKGGAQHWADRTPERLRRDQGCHEEPERRAERR